jgi:hypothetical protein
MSEQPPRPDLRASDEDRERLVADLREHAVAGRINTDELEQRAQAVYSAKTTAELDALRRDLPMTKQALALSHTERRAHLTRRLIQETGGTAALFVVGTAIWLVGGASGQFWPVWILIVVVLSLARNGWALFGPAPDLDAVEQHLNQRRERRVNRDDKRGRRRLDR